MWTTHETVLTTTSITAVTESMRNAQSTDIDPDSIQVKQAKLEPSLADIEIGETVQFERLGYFCIDTESTDDQKIFNRTVPLRDSWAKIAKKS